jgi:hypothetical protein
LVTSTQSAAVTCPDQATERIASALATARAHDRVRSSGTIFEKRFRHVLEQPRQRPVIPGPLRRNQRTGRIIRMNGRRREASVLPGRRGGRSTRGTLVQDIEG